MSGLKSTIFFLVMIPSIGCSEVENSRQTSKQGDYEPIIVKVKQFGPDCSFYVGERIFSDKDFAFLSSLAKANPARPIELSISGKSPYKCIGGAVSKLQGLGFTRVGVVSDLVNNPSG